MSETSANVERDAGLLASARRLLDSVLGLLRTRLEIIACEFEEEREHVKALLLFGAIALALISLGIVALTAFVTLWLWATYGLYALAIVGAAFLFLGVGLLWYVRRRERARPALFSTTLFELVRDQDTLRGRQ